MNNRMIDVVTLVLNGLNGCLLFGADASFAIAIHDEYSAVTVVNYFESVFNETIWQMIEDGYLIEKDGKYYLAG